MGLVACRFYCLKTSLKGSSLEMFFMLSKKKKKKKNWGFETMGNKDKSTVS